jgi:hypothetical protein
MKTKLIILIALVLNGLIVWGQFTKNVYSPDSITGKVIIKQITECKWNSGKGIPYSQVPGANLGATSFELIDTNRIAFLCNSSNEIIISDIANDSVLKKITLNFTPRDFIYSNGLFYILNDSEVVAVNEDADLIYHFTFPSIYRGVERIARYDNGTYLLLPSANCLKIEFDNHSIDPQIFEGWVTSSGNFIRTMPDGDNSYTVRVITNNKNIYEKKIITDKKVAGVYVVGTVKNRIILDVQTFISEHPISVERNIVVLEYNQKGIDSIITTQRVPECYYVLSNKDFSITENGKILNMISEPQGLYIFSLTESKSNESIDYPDFIRKTRYHFNEHLMIIDEKQ